MTALGIRYLRGYAVATDIMQQRAEWPPHPGRVFMAMAAAYFGSGQDMEERHALEWLQDQEPPPAIYASESRERSLVETYVPVNDRLDKTAGPTLRSRQPRTFPTVRPDNDSVFLIWENDAPTPVRTALEQLCGKVTRIGHSSSLVQMWVADQSCPAPNFWPDDRATSQRLRIAEKGTLQYLEQAFHGGAHPVRPALTQWQGYSPVGSQGQQEQTISGPFHSQIIILSKYEGRTLGLESTLSLTGALRHAAMKAAGETAPEWLSGHQTDGSPTLQPHAAFFPLPYVDAQYADGHIMGLAIALPRHMAADGEVRRVIGSLLFTERGKDKHVHLWRGKCNDKIEDEENCLWDWKLTRETRPSLAEALRTKTWTRASRTWASVTPLVLHHHPKKHRSSDTERIVREAFQSARLPEPETVTIQPVSAFRGAGHALSLPEFTEGGAGLCRYQVHCVVRFPVPVEGPVLVGRGRFRGYGLFRPFGKEERGEPSTKQ